MNAKKATGTGTRKKGFFSPSQWEINALITISAQLAAIEKKQNHMLRLLGRLSELQDVAAELSATSDTLATIVEAQTKGTKQNG